MSNPGFTGRSIARREDRGFLTGTAIYVADLSHPLLEAAAYVAFVRSTVAHAHLRSIDTTEALDAAGVLDVVTAEENDVFAVRPSFLMVDDPIFAQPLLAERKVRYVGEPIAAVVASSQVAAIDAAELVVVDYEPLPPVLDLDEALGGPTLLFEPGDAPRLQASLGDHTAAGPPDRNVLGRVEAEPSPFPACEVDVEQTVWNPRQSAAPIEPRGMAVAWTDDGGLRVWAATQRPHGFRDQLAELYELDAASVHVIAGPNVGGGFGGKVSRTVEEHLLPLLARRVGRPVRWIDTRSEYQAAAPHGRGERYTIRVGGSADGRIAALAVSLVKDLGGYPGGGTHLPASFTARMAAGPYDIDHVWFESVGVVTNRAPAGSFRGAGRAALIAALERTVDLFAARTGIDPAVVRRRNLVRPDQMPYPSPGGEVYDEADYGADLDRALIAADYERLRGEQADRRAAGDSVHLGIGVACYNHMTTSGGGEEADVSIRPDGGALVLTGTTSQGQGHHTTWAQIAADVLGIPLDGIEVVEGDSSGTATGVGAVASRSLQTAGVAIHAAATTVVEQARALAAELLEAALDDIVLDHDRGAFHVAGTPARSLSWAELVAASAPDRELRCGEIHDVEGHNTFPSGCHVAVVDVDAETGRVELRRLVAVDDAGVRVNPTIVDGQLHGGIAAGVAQALGEEVIYDDDGNLLTATFADYAIATIDQFPQFELTASQMPSSYNPHGFKAVGESGVIGATPAVHNAVIDALSPFDVEHLDLPCTPERVWRAIAGLPQHHLGRT